MIEKIDSFKKLLSNICNNSGFAVVRSITNLSNYDLDGVGVKSDKESPTKLEMLDYFMNTK